MRYYSYYKFVQADDTPSTYLLESQFGSIPDFDPMRYTDCSRNKKSGKAGREFIRFVEPRRLAMRKYFAYTVEMKGRAVLTSTEKIDNEGRTFGDTKSIGVPDLILIKFSQDRKYMELWAVRNQAKTKTSKFDAFDRWVNGEELVPEYL